MGENTEKTKFSIRLDNNLLKVADSYIAGSTMQNRTELIEYALRFSIQKMQKITCWSLYHL